MKKIILIIFVSLFIFAIIFGASFLIKKDSNDNNEDISNKSWENLDICVDGKWMTFPMSFEKMESYGWKLPEKNEDKRIEGTMSYHYELINDDKDYTLGVSVANYSEDTKNIKECMISGVSVSVEEFDYESKSYKEKNSHASIKIPVNDIITFGMNKDEFIKQLGSESTDKYTFSKQDTYTTSYTDNTRSLAYTDYTYIIKTEENYKRFLTFSVYPEAGILDISLKEQIR